MIAGVPYDAEVEYLESWGGVNVDTGVLSAAGTLVDVVCESFTPPPYPSAILRSFNFTWGGEGFAIFLETSNSIGNAIFYIGQGDGNIDSRPKAIRNIPFRIYQESNGVWYYNGTRYSSTESHYNTYNTNSNLGIGSLNVEIAQSPLWRIYSLKIHRTGVLVRDFIPVRVGQVGYMYDRVTRRLFGNAGTGAFVLGPDVATPVMGLRNYPEPEDA